VYAVLKITIWEDVNMLIAHVVFTLCKTEVLDWQTRSQDREAGAVVSCWRGRHLIDR
jgi:hypothetical protein